MCVCARHCGPSEKSAYAEKGQNIAERAIRDSRHPLRPHLLHSLLRQPDQKKFSTTRKIFERKRSKEMAKSKKSKMRVVQWCRSQSGPRTGLGKGALFSCSACAGVGRRCRYYCWCYDLEAVNLYKNLKNYSRADHNQFSDIVHHAQELSEKYF